MAKIAVLVPYPAMCDLACPMVEKFSNIEPMCIEYTETEQIRQRAMTLEQQGCELIIARGLQATLARQAVKIPVVEMRVTAQEIAKLVLELKEELGAARPKICLIGFSNMFCDTSCFHSLFGIEMPRYMVENTGELSQLVDKARDNGCHAVIGGYVVCTRAQELGFPCRFIPSGRESLLDAFNMASQICYAIDLEKSNQAEMDTMLNYTFSGIVRLDTHGIVIQANKVAFSLLGLQLHDMLGRNIADVLSQIPRARFEQALNEGKESYAIHIPVQKRAIVINIAPILIENVIKGAVLTLQEDERIVEMESELRKELYQRGYIARKDFSQIPTLSKENKEMVTTAKRIAKYNAPILMTGEAGSGKRIIAQCIHNEGLSRGNAFVALDCAAFQSDTLDTMLFGNYTIRKDSHACLVEIAQNGTLYLSHVDALSPELQFRIFELSHGRYYHNGSHLVTTSNIRLITASDINLFTKVKQGVFRHDLYYSLSVLCLEFKPLRHHKEDSMGWIKFYLEEFQRQHKRYINLTQEAKDFLSAYDWPGNLNQIRSLCERIVLMADRRNVGDAFIRRQLEQLTPDVIEGTEQIVIYKEKEAVQITALLKKYNGNRAKVSEELGISKTTLWRKMKKYGIEEEYHTV